MWMLPWFRAILTHFGHAWTTKRGPFVQVSRKLPTVYAAIVMNDWIVHSVILIETHWCWNNWLFGLGRDCTSLSQVSLCDRTIQPLQVCCWRVLLLWSLGHHDRRWLYTTYIAKPVLLLVDRILHWCDPDNLMMITSLCIRVIGLSPVLASRRLEFLRTQFVIIKPVRIDMDWIVLLGLLMNRICFLYFKCLVHKDAWRFV